MTRRRIAIVTLLGWLVPQAAFAEGPDLVEIGQWLEAPPAQVEVELRQAMGELHAALLGHEAYRSSQSPEGREIRTLLVRVHERLAEVVEAKGETDRMRWHLHQILRLEPGYADRGGALAQKVRADPASPSRAEPIYELQATQGDLKHHPRIIAIEGQAFRVFAYGDALEDPLLIYCGTSCRTERFGYDGKRLQRRLSESPVLGTAERALDSTAIMSRAGWWAFEIPANRVQGQRFSYRIEATTDGGATSLGTPSHVVQVVDNLKDFEVYEGFGPRAREAAELWRMRFWPKGATTLGPEWDGVDFDSPRVFRRNRLNDAFR